MKLTKKQLAALQKIVGREQARFNETAFKESREKKMLIPAKISGAHPCGDRYGITDGVIAALFCEKPDEIVESDRMDLLDQYAKGFMDDGDLQLVENPLSVEDCKKIIADWKAADNTIGKPSFPQVTVSVMREDGVQLVSQFNAKLYLNALEVAGPYRAVYLGNSTKIRVPFPCLFIFKRYGRDGENNWNEPIFLLPCRPD